MAGQKGQPSGNPAQLKGPIPRAEPASAGPPSLDAEYAKLKALDAEYAKLKSMDEAGSSEVASTGEETQGLGYTGPGAGALQMAADAAPVALGIAGGIAGMAAGPLGSIGLAAAGGAAGQGYRDFIETQILGKPEGDPNEMLMQTGKTALTEGAGQAVGLGAGKVASLAAKSKLGQAAIAKATQLAEKPTQYFKGIIEAGRDRIKAPLMQILETKATQLNAEQSGDAAKQLLLNNIKGKYGPFIQAYADLDGVAKAIPVQDEVRRGFTVKLKGWALDNLGGDNYRIVKKFADDLDAAGNGMQIDDILGQIKDMKRTAYNTGATQQGAVLKEVEDRVTGFMENEVTKLAARAQAGKASPQEMQFLSQIMQQRGIQDDPVKYAKVLAKDYLAAKDKVAKDYSGFRAFLEDVSEQTKVKLTKRTSGPTSFMDALDDIPSEKLIERMFDPKNARALRLMKNETPEVFEEVAKARVKLARDRATTGGKLDLAAFRKEVERIPESTRYMLFSPDDIKTLNLVVDNPSLRKFDHMEKLGDNAMARLVVNVMGATGEVAKDMAKRPRVQGAAAYATGRPLVSAFGPQTEPVE